MHRVDHRFAALDFTRYNQHLFNRQRRGQFYRSLRQIEYSVESERVQCDLRVAFSKFSHELIHMRLSIGAARINVKQLHVVSWQL
jgi:hypothetical protein